MPYPDLEFISVNAAADFLIVVHYLSEQLTVEFIMPFWAEYIITYNLFAFARKIGECNSVCSAADLVRE